jgi:replicative DNA helicase
VEKKVYELKQLPITITGMKETTLESLVKLIRLMVKDEYAMFIVDSLDMITIDGVSEDTQRIGIITKTVKDLAKELDINVSFIHHYTKGSDKDRANGDRGLASMKGSVKVENNSDMVVRIARNLSNDEFAMITPMEKAEVRVSLLKDRVYGDPGTKTIYFQGGSYSDHFNAHA